MDLGILQAIRSVPSAWIERAFIGVLPLHVGLGLLALIFFWVAMASRKGGARHLRFGRLYVSAMYATLATAAVVMALSLCAPLATHPPETSLSAPQLEAYIADVRGFQFFLGGLAFATLGLLSFGDGAARGARARGVRAPLGSGSPCRPAAGSDGSRFTATARSPRRPPARAAPE